MKFPHFESETKGHFEYKVDGVLLGEISYSRVGKELIIIDHTFVDPSLRGSGKGKELVTEVVEYARAKSLKVLPLCPFANAIIKRESAFHDVLSK